MARRAGGEEHVQVLRQHSAPEEVQLEPVRNIEQVDMVPIAGDATAKNRQLTAEQLATIPEVKRYRVVKGGTILMKPGNYRATLKAGKEIDSQNYDVRELQRQGIKVERIASDMPSDEAFVD